MKRSILHAAFATIVAACMCVTALSPAQSAGKAPIKMPKNPTGLTSKALVVRPIPVLDPASPYAPQVACNPYDMPGPLKVRSLVLATYRAGGPGNIARGCTGGVSEHSEGRAWDWMIDPKSKRDKAAAADFLAWATANKGYNARRLGIMYLIYNEKIWAVYRQAEGWRKSFGHKDHIHVSFGWAGARANTSFWTGEPSAIDYGPCALFAGQPAVLRSTPRDSGCLSTAALVKRSKLSTLGWGSRSSAMGTAQKALKVKKTGVFDRATWTAVKAYQKKHDLPRNGVLDQPTWSSLTPTKVRSDVAAGFSPYKAATYGLKKYGKTSIGKNATGKAALMVQVALAVRPADRNGYLGPQTRAAVKRLQKSARLKQTGKVSKAEWAALVRMRKADRLR